MLICKTSIYLFTYSYIYSEYIYTFAKSLLFVLLIEFSYHECFIYIYPSASSEE